MYTPIQQALIDKMVKFGWELSQRDCFHHPDHEYKAAILRTEDNVCIMYPDGSQDRALEQDLSRKLRVLPREGWFSKDVKNRVRRQCLRTEPTPEVQANRLITQIESMIESYARSTATRTHHAHGATMVA